MSKVHQAPRTLHTTSVRLWFRAILQNPSDASFLRGILLFAKPDNLLHSHCTYARRAGYIHTYVPLLNLNP